MGKKEYCEYLLFDFSDMYFLFHRKNAQLCFIGIMGC